jgi:hypothetical protein
MTNVLFRVNLGSVDAGRLGIADFRVCLAGNEATVPDAAAKTLAAAGIASIVEVVPPPKTASPAVSVELKADPVVVPETELAADPAVVSESKDKKKK